MSKALVCVSLIGVAILCTGGCDPITTVDPNTIVTITVVNDSQTQFVQPKLRVCPEGMLVEPHFPLANPPILAPGQSVTYTTAQIAGASGNCQTFSTNFMLGLCGWGYGTDRAALLDTAARYGGQIGFQFHCGDTVILHWTDGAEAGTWSSEVQPAEGNPAPVAAFQSL